MPSELINGFAVLTSGSEAVHHAVQGRRGVKCAARFVVCQSLAESRNHKLQISSTSR